MPTMAAKNFIKLFFRLSESRVACLLLPPMATPMAGFSLIGVMRTEKLNLLMIPFSFAWVRLMGRGLYLRDAEDDHTLGQIYG